MNTYSNPIKCLLTNIVAILLTIVLFQHSARANDIDLKINICPINILFSKFISVSKKVKDCKNSFEYDISLCVQLINNKDYDKAINVLKDQLNNNLNFKDAADVHRLIGTIFLLKNEKRKAFKEFNTSLHLDPNNINSILIIESIFGIYEDFDKEVECYKGNILQDPKDILSYLKLGELFYKSYDFDAALLEYKNVIDIDPKNVEAQIGIGKIYYISKNYDEAIKIFISVLKIYPKAIEASYYLELSINASNH